MLPATTLFMIIFLEGYIVLSTELLAIRLLMPFTGSGTDTVSIVIAAVLLPLAFGYFVGGKFRAGGKKKNSVRKRLIKNLLISMGVLTVGLSYFFLEWAFPVFEKATGMYNRIFLTSLYCAIFIIYPVYLLGQTVPLISNYFSRQRLAAVAGKMLFFSTLGSFMGAVFGTLVLMAFLGVHNTVVMTLAGMTVLTFLLSRRKASVPVILSTLFLVAAVAVNSPQAMKKLNIVSNNQYSVVQIEEMEDMGLRALKLNRSYASVIFQYSPEMYSEYGIYMHDSFIGPMMEGEEEKSVLVLGAGGFVLGREDHKNRYTYVDIDGALKKVSEEDFLKEELGPNKEFVVMDARAFLLQSKEKYDLIIVDLYRDPVSVPENMTTVEFFKAVRAHLKVGGVMAGNFWASVNFSDAYSRNLDSTLRAALPYLNRQIVTPFNGWKRDEDWTNIVYSYVNVSEKDDIGIYTDDKNPSFYDRPATLPH